MSRNKCFMHILSIWTMLINNLLHIDWCGIPLGRTECQVLSGVAWRRPMSDEPLTSFPVRAPSGLFRSEVLMQLVTEFCLGSPMIWWLCYFFALILYFHEYIRNLAKINATNKWSCPVIVENAQEVQERKGKIEKEIWVIRHLGE